MQRFLAVLAARYMDTFCHRRDYIIAETARKHSGMSTGENLLLTEGNTYVLVSNYSRRPWGMSEATVLLNNGSCGDIFFHVGVNWILFKGPEK